MGVSLQIVGLTEESYVGALRQRFPSVEVVGTVPDIRPYISRARIALVPDVLGGFKLKSFDYIFGRLPIFGIEGAVSGTPLSDGRGIRLFNSHSALAHSVADTIDDTATLNRLGETAYALLAHRFDWSSIGRDLIQRIRGRPLPASGITIRICH
jgi:hypothetical protein